MKEALFAQTSAIILSAGSSLRMGTQKALLRFDDEHTFLQKITETYLKAGAEQVIVVVNTGLYALFNENNLDLPEQVILVSNEKPELGRFYSLQTGIKKIKPGNYCFFQNIDNPFTSAHLINSLISEKDDADVIIPAFQKKTGHPVLLSPVVTETMLKVIDYEIRIDQFLKKFNVKEVETNDNKVLVNINSPEEFLGAGFKF